MNKIQFMDIGSKNGYPASALSNFAPHPFELDGVKCNSMEGFLQGLKFESKEMQEYVCTLVGFAAKKKGGNKNWQHNQTLYWRGEPIKRDSEEYQNLLNRAYNAMYHMGKIMRHISLPRKSSGYLAVCQHRCTQNYCSHLYLLHSHFLPNITTGNSRDQIC